MLGQTDVRDFFTRPQGQVEVLIFSASRVTRPRFGGGFDTEVNQGPGQGKTFSRGDPRLQTRSI